MATYLDENGYLSYEKMMKLSRNFNFVIGARGLGKTCQTKEHILHSDTPILYVRRFKVQAGLQCSDDGDFTKDFMFPMAIFDWSEKYGIGKVYLTESDVENQKPSVIIVSLSTFQNLTGVDLTNVYTVVFDEFIPQKGDRPLKHEFQAYKNIMEIVYRNRPFEDTEKIKVWFYGNSNAISSNILLGYKLIETVYKMVHKSIEYATPTDGIALFIPLDSPVSQRKAKNAFYRNLPDNRANMELRNAFSDLDDSHVCHKNLKEYNHEILLPCFSISRAKGDDWDNFYITKPLKAKPFCTYANTETDLEKWQTVGKKYFKSAFMRGKISFASYEVQTMFLASFDCVSWNDLL